MRSFKILLVFLCLSVLASSMEIDDRKGKGKGKGKKKPKPSKPKPTPPPGGNEEEGEGGIGGGKGAESGEGTKDWSKVWEIIEKLKSMLKEIEGNHGSVYCYRGLSRLGGEASCHLECDPGYAPSSTTSLPSSGLPSSARCEPAVALVTGGLVASTTAEAYGPGLHRQLPNLPDSRVGHTLDYVDSLVLACGGSTLKGPPIPPLPPALKSCIQLNVPALTWDTHSSMAYSRDIHASAVNLGRLTVLGGTDSNTTMETLRPVVSKSWSDAAIRATKYSCAAKISAEEFMVTGGTELPASAISYNVLNGQTGEMVDMIQERSGHGCATVKHRASGIHGVVVAGGYPGGGAVWETDVSLSTTNKVELFNLATKSWRLLGNLNMARRGLKLVYVQDTLLAMGGFNGTAYVAAVEKFDFLKETWSYVDDMFVPRAFPGVTAVPMSMFN